MVEVETTEAVIQVLKAMDPDVLYTKLKCLTLQNI